MKLAKTIYLYFTLAVVALVSLSSCGMMTEEEPDCNPYYKVRFRFDRNMLFADAFSSQVGEVDLYVFDEEGKLVWKGHEEGDALAEEGYLMDLPVAPGKYDLVAWCHKRHENAAGFNLAESENPQEFGHLKMKMDREYDGDQAHSTTDLHALFHGKISTELPDTWGTHVVTLPLTKDTNCIRIQLVHLSGSEIKAKDFDFKIVDSNGHLDHENKILEDEIIHYRPWAINEGVVTTVPPTGDEKPGIDPIPDTNDGVRAITTIHSLTEEMTTSRLQMSQNPTLIITRKSDGENVVTMPIIEYFMMVKGQYNRHMDEDEYLDRQDEYNMTLFMNEDNSWYKAVLDILSWRVVRQFTDL